MVMAAGKGRALRVLVAEDDTSLRRLLEMRLSVDGYEVRSAVDGADALETISGWTPDIIVTDVMMPRVSGLTLVREVRAGETTAAIPIVLLTARCFDADIQAAVDMGNVRFMNKPFNARSLDRTMQEMLGEPAVEAEGQPQGRFAPTTGIPELG